ncbi:hypothetical protein ACT17_27360 [Mycolicibacterium conceptionense]|uniref:Transmembrane protein n=2 Tax=Mycolicibacterium TaxID=1866885 RepID=A0ABR5FYH5_9MYCO|nr:MULTISPECIES: hypothetical protein [Mycolicibacterium]KLI08925.1 hypothetical protein AA982_05390 [Mycolicibacterium senegalense]KLO53002.1 hypothetical protein ABW05_17365 [Mycolicibacterium senegalense]KMV14950.1 hypothetical protein ACT17_27360 [Mycolicibacterium conceptionense]OBJ95899.1 hypothetical protein A5639_03550 [Mycolicibacterium conceptionense]OMB71754.1 hypothetical protein A5741_06690 [Mycolicibacterium conceptionense]
MSRAGARRAGAAVVFAAVITVRIAVPVVAPAVILALVPVVPLAGTIRRTLTAVRPATIRIGKRQRSPETGDDQARKHQTGRGGDAQPRTHVVTTLSRTARKLV